ncbi:EF hand [Dictyocaulus viviparus]|uniref:EF hand n=1 Tax=Dictyocaulus viviparus TaxID=29172 RepID=A0A0D8X8M0_DICVI|nr:EF hand [Dictyocaulus viviparus]
MFPTNKTHSAARHDRNKKKKIHQLNQTEQDESTLSRKGIIEEYKKAFKFFDQNNDGFITMSELEKAMNECGQYPSKLELHLVMSHGDRDQNGVITFDEFVQLMSGRNTGGKYTYSQLLEQFNMFDKLSFQMDTTCSHDDKDGYIEKSEMIECVNELSLSRIYPRSVVEALFNDADADGDGKISFEDILGVIVMFSILMS